MPDNNNDNTSSTENPNTIFRAHTVFVKLFPDMSKIEVFSGQNFRRWQERVSTLLDMYGVATALTSSKPNSNIPSKQVKDWIHANKVCRHTLLSALSNDLFDVYCSYKEAKEIWDSLILKYTAKEWNYFHWLC